LSALPFSTFPLRRTVACVLRSESGVGQV
jgi:hypothetical protein